MGGWGGVVGSGWVGDVVGVGGVVGWLWEWVVVGSGVVVMVVGG